MYVPRRMFLTRGLGVHREKLTSFEMALRNARIAQYNLVEVSSIFPPSCEMVDASRGVEQLSPGQIVHVVLSKCQTNEPGRQIAASVGVATPVDKSICGYLSEHHSFGEEEEQAGRYAEELAAEMLATILGVEYNPDLSYDEKKEIWKISGKIVESFSLTQSAKGDATGKWTTVLAASVLLP